MNFETNMEVDDIVTTIHSIEELRYIKVVAVRVSKKLAATLKDFNIPEFHNNCFYPYASVGGKTKIRMFVCGHQAAPWLLTVTPVNNKSDRKWRE